MNIIPNMPMEEYLALPAVSASIIKRMVDECPKAAWFDSWINPHRLVRTSDEMDAGTIAHSILLEGGPGNVEVIDPNDHPAEKTGAIPAGWTNKSIRAARDAARAAGKIPVLSGDMARISAMVNAAREYIECLKDTEPAVWAAFQPNGGDSEVTITFEHDGIPCRIRPDRLHALHTLIVDAKFTATSAEPNRWARTQLTGMGYYLSAAFYRLAFDVPPDYVFLVVQSEPPYLCSLVGIDPAGYELGHQKVLHGLGMWAQCVKRNQWPAYSTRVCYAEIPAYVHAEFEARMGIEYDYEVLFDKKGAA